MSKECPSREELLGFVEGVASGDASSDLKEHIMSCETCRATAAELRAEGTFIRAIGATARHRTTGCPDPETLAAYADDSLAGSDARTVESHLKSCGACLSEICDLWELSGDESHDVRETVITRILARLSDESRTAVVRLAGQALSVITDFAQRAGEAIGEGFADERAPAVATVRAGGERVALTWSGSDGLSLACSLGVSGPDVTLTGELTRAGQPAKDVSVAMVGTDRRGPESVDSAGRFGPWPISAGENRIVLTSARLDPVELRLELVAGESSPPGDR